MERTNIEKIRQVIEQLSQQINHLDTLMCVEILSKSVLTKEEICNLLISIAEHKFLIEQLRTAIDDALGVDVKRLTRLLKCP